MENPEKEIQSFGEMAIMSKDGDTKIIWDRSKPDEVENARENFDRLTGKGYFAFSVKGSDGDKGEQINSFNPEAERIIFAPKLAGG
jgi:hypothetical protein